MSQAAGAYRRAMELAAGQGARSPELRAQHPPVPATRQIEAGGALAWLRELHDQFEGG